MSTYKHVFFDLDRTLWDFDTNSQIALTEIFREFKLHEKGVESYESFLNNYEKINDKLWGYYRIGSLSKKDLRKKRFTKTIETFGIVDSALGERMDSRYLEISPFQTTLMPNTIEVLDYLKAKYKLHIITNGFEEVQQFKLQRSGLDSYFDQVLTSERAMGRKPDPMVFQLAMKMADAGAHESIMIGDDLRTDIEGARSVWMDQVYYNPKGTPHNDEVTHEIIGLEELKTII